MATSFHEGHIASSKNARTPGFAAAGISGIQRDL